jgi:hypothetical protein
MIYLQRVLHMFISNVLLIITIKPRAKEFFSTAPFVDILRNISLHTSWIILEYLSPYIISWLKIKWR